MCNFSVMISVSDKSVALVKQMENIFYGKSKTSLTDRLLRPVIDTLAHVIKHSKNIPYIFYFVAFNSYIATFVIQWALDLRTQFVSEGWS
jgi:hypothetical protein